MSPLTLPTLAQLKQMSMPQLTDLCARIRSYLIDSISTTGGHIGANLGVIELSVALHYVFDSPTDKVIFDTGHQGYTHKLLTGREKLFSSLNSFGGMSRFLSAEESEFDILSASHAGTAISTGAGIALAGSLSGDSFHTIAVVGDGALVEGVCFEGLNFCPEKKLPLIIIINDNGMAIAPNIGGVKNLFAGKSWAQKAASFFSALGYSYLPVEDGHSLPALIEAMQTSRTLCGDGPVIVHAKTIKGKGLPYADDHPYRMHFSMPFNPQTGAGAAPTPAGESYARVASQTLLSLMRADDAITVITPATPYASELDPILSEFPDRTLDVGMAEQHAVSMAAGLAMSGNKPVACMQSTFMQRAYDQILHDIAYPDLPVTLLAVRSGFAGYDSPTHHGIYDFSYLQGIPNFMLFYAGTVHDLDRILRWRLTQPLHPMVICYPYEPVRAGEVPPAEPDDILRPQFSGKPQEITLITTGNCLGTAYEVEKNLATQGKKISIVNIRWIKPFPEAVLLPYLHASRLVICLEEHVATGGIGMRLAALCTDHRTPCRLLRIAVRDAFITAGDKVDLNRVAGIDCESVCRRIMGILNE